MPKLFKTNGMDCGDAPLGFYDFIFSSICLQHIASYKVRYRIFESMYTVLKTGGKISIQMGFGPTIISNRKFADPWTVSYYDDYFKAVSTNGHCDTQVTNPDQISEDLDSIGFTNFAYEVRPPGPGENKHQNWIFFEAQK